jgi:hypothetical protein
MLVVALGVGLQNNPDGITLASHTFSPIAHLSDGRHVELAESGPIIYLQSCRDRSTVVSVNADEILLRTGITSSSPPDPGSVFGLLFRGEKGNAGYRPPC